MGNAAGIRLPSRSDVNGSGWERPSGSRAIRGKPPEAEPDVAISSQHHDLPATRPSSMAVWASTI
jgi:hypothetical protein